ncbi:hypothetical protein HHK36_013270 [Tetracentron sinense]|uniref:Uncharacterized protein n=1 Tax=Tetracentron sinense TaxID=13715 RepID=A0A835DGF1_TETSI|nr:hypothetical protein HHK36_013270 [Tetracentron sinense]
MGNEKRDKDEGFGGEKMRKGVQERRWGSIFHLSPVRSLQTSDPRSGFATVEKDLPGSLTPMLGDRKVSQHPSLVFTLCPQFAVSFEWKPISAPPTSEWSIDLWASSFHLMTASSPSNCFAAFIACITIGVATDLAGRVFSSSKKIHATPISLKVHKNVNYVIDPVFNLASIFQVEHFLGIKRKPEQGSMGPPKKPKI